MSDTERLLEDYRRQQMAAALARRTVVKELSLRHKWPQKRIAQAVRISCRDVSAILRVD